MRSTLLLRRLGAYVLDVAVLFVMLAPLGYFVQRSLGISPVTISPVTISPVTAQTSCPARLDSSSGGLATLARTVCD